MKVLFLDFDGVLNVMPSRGLNSGDIFTKLPCMNLEFLLKRAPDLNIVVSSAWRMWGLQGVKDILQKNGIDPRRVIDTTGNEPGARGHQIDCWLKRNQEVKTFAIVDDDNDMAPYMDKLVKTSSYIGLTQANVEKVLEILGEK